MPKTHAERQAAYYRRRKDEKAGKREIRGHFFPSTYWLIRRAARNYILAKNLCGRDAEDYAAFLEAMKKLENTNGEK